MAHRHHHDHHRAYLSAAPGAAPTMSMVLSWSTDPGPLLFASWHPTSFLSYVLSLAVIFGLAVSTEAARHGRLGRRAEMPLLAGDAGSEEEIGELQRRAPRPADRGRGGGGVSACMAHAASIGAGYALMLLAMSFNVGVLIAVVGGLAVGRTAYEQPAAQTGRGRSAEEMCH